MFGTLRRRTRGLAAIVVLAVVALSTAAPHAAGGHDAHGTGAFAAHDPAAHRIGTGATDAAAHEQHCAVCHWTRSFRPDSRSGAPFAAPGPRDLPLHRITFRAPLVFPAAQPPLRSPPVSPAAAV